MASNFSLPIDLTDEVALRRFLTTIINSLDELIDVPTSINNTMSETSEDSSLENRVTILEEDDIRFRKQLKSLESTNTHKAIAAAIYNDFNAAAWGDLIGNNQFTELGANLTNAPFIPVGGTSYTFYIESKSTVGGGIVQQMVVEVPSTTTLMIYFRAGDTFAQAILNGWQNV